jgi:hypothetical protein
LIDFWSDIEAESVDQRLPKCLPPIFARICKKTPFHRQNRGPFWKKRGFRQRRAWDGLIETCDGSLSSQVQGATTALDGDGACERGGRCCPGFGAATNFSLNERVGSCSDLHRAHRAPACGIRGRLMVVVEGPDAAGNTGSGERVRRNHAGHVRRHARQPTDAWGLTRGG